MRVLRGERRKSEAQMKRIRKSEGMNGRTLADKLELELKTLAEQEKRKYLFLASASADRETRKRYENQADAVDLLVGKFRALIKAVLRD